MTLVREKVVPALLYVELYAFCLLLPRAQKTFPQWEMWTSLLTTWRSATAQCACIVPNDLPSHVRQELDDTTMYFEHVGFDNLGDFVLQVSATSAPSTLSLSPLAAPHVPVSQQVMTKVYCRVMKHREHPCTLLVQIEPKAEGSQGNPLFRGIMFSRSGDWSYSTCTYAREIHWLALPRALWSEISLGRLEKQHPGHALQEMFNSHVASAAFIAQRANLKWDAPLALDEMASLECQNFECLRAFALRSSRPAFILRAIHAQLESRCQWLGELNGK
jgi:hypothetical protein